LTFISSSNSHDQRPKTDYNAADLRDIIAMLVTKSKAGDMTACRLLLDRIGGNGLRELLEDIGELEAFVSLRLSGGGG
jgi:ribosomal protein L17